MKILLSAYAYEPGKGSEPGVGWHWAEEIARRGHEVVVLTCGKHHRESIERYSAALGNGEDVRVEYYDLPQATDWLFRNYRFMHLHCYLWQFGAYRRARALNAREHFDAVHHITWGSFRIPSQMGRLGIPFILGPVGGGEHAPWRLRIGYIFRGWVWDCLRDISNTLVRLDPFVRRMFRQATVICAKTGQSNAAIPKRYRSKVSVLSEIGVAMPINSIAERDRSIKSNELSVLYVGRFLYWKGFHFGLPALANLLINRPTISLTMVGRGKDEAAIRRLANVLAFDRCIEWIPWTSQETLVSIYRQHDVFLFPSMHDSSGKVVLEALSQGLPVICLDLGGPAMMVDESCGRVVETAGRSRAEVIGGLVAALDELAADPDLRRTLSEGAVRRAQDFAWEKVVDRVYKQVENGLSG